MPDNNGAPPAPPAPPAGAPGATPPAPPARVPFDQDAALQDYINRQVENRLNDSLARIQAAQPKPPNGDGKDPLDAIAEELATEEKLDPAAAKNIVSKFKRIVEHTTSGLRNELENSRITQRFAQVFGKYSDEDTKAVAPVMTEMFKGLTALERNFVLNSPDGADWLYERARAKSSRSQLPPEVRAAAGAPPGRGAPPAGKLDSTSGLFAKANDLMRKGDRAGYEEVMAQINRG